MGPLETSWTRNWPLWAAMAMCALLGIMFIFQTTVTVDGVVYYTLADDVMISLTYARNLAEGNGLVWVPGGAPVEGYSNPLWTVWLAVLEAVSPDDRLPLLLTALSGLACLLAGLAGADQLMRRLGADQPGRVFGLLCAATLYPAAFWSIRGFEVGALIAVLTWMLALALDKERRGAAAAVPLGALAAIAFLIRMDALAMAGVIVALRLLRFDRTGLREFAIALSIAAAAVAGLTVFREAYYGDIVPNTAHLKLEHMPILSRIRAGLSADAHAALQWSPFALLAIAPLALLRTRAAQLRVAGVLAAICTQGAYVAWIGGDAWEWSHFPDRFLSVTGFAVCAVAGLGAGMVLDAVKLAPRSRTLCAVPAALALSVAIGGGAWVDTFSGRGFQIRQEARLIADGIALRRGTAPGFSYAITWAGTIPYFAPGRVPIDLLGKMDPVIARMQPNPRSGPFHPGHNKFSLEHSIGDLRPDAILHTVDGSEDAIRRIRAWGYEQTPGGWWIRADARDRVTDPALFDYRF